MDQTKTLKNMQAQAVVAGQGTSSMSNNSSSVSDSSAAASKPSALAYMKHHFRDYGMLLALVVIMGLFQVLTDGTLMRPINLTNLFLQNSYIIIMAFGMLLVIVAGHIDLSVGSVVGFVGAAAAVMMVHWGWSMALVVPACLLLGCAIGAAQGYWIAYWKIPSFIVTLAGSPRC